MLFEKLVVLDSVIFYPEHRERLDRMAREVVEYNTCRTEDEVSERCAGADAIISCWVDIPHRIIDENPQLKAIAFWTHDFEHRIDANYATSRGIHVPAIPDYGTDAVAELVFLGLLSMFSEVGDGAETSGAASLEEEVVFRFGDDVRRLSANVKDNLAGRWFHEYVKTGKLRVDSPDGIPGETLKGMTVGVLGQQLVSPELVQLVSKGLGMNLIYALADAPHTMDTAFRPVDDVLAVAQIVIYDGSHHPWVAGRLRDQPRLLSATDVSQLDASRSPLRGKTLAILGLGRIGSRVAQIATQGLGMSVVYHSRTRKPELEEAWGLEYMSFEDIFSSGEILTIHLPHHGAEDLVTRQLVDKIPSGTVFVNCSVGSIIEDEAALLDRCEAGELRAFLDVYRTLPPRSRLRELRENVLATYRLGWRTKATVGLKTHKLLTKLENPPQPYSPTSS